MDETTPPAESLPADATGSAPPAPAPNPAGRADRVRGLSVVAAAFLASLGLSYWARSASEPAPPKPPAAPITKGIAGWPKAVDPVKNLALARTITDRTLLRGIYAEGVTQDGLVDVTRKKGRVRYAFQSPPGQGPQPKRAADTLPIRHYCGRQDVRITAKGAFAERDVTDHPCRSHPADPLPEPRCTPKDVWEHALKRGAPKKKRAKLEYYRARAGPAWRFRVSGTEHRFSLYGDCGRELTKAEAQNYGG
jgi:hypothetical protein